EEHAPFHRGPGGGRAVRARRHRPAGRHRFAEEPRLFAAGGDGGAGGHRGLRERRRRAAAPRLQRRPALRLRHRRAAGRRSTAGALHHARRVRHPMRHPPAHAGAGDGAL
ncbi:MAG: Copper binding protein, plastocyanin/azurin family, partial [uncultured Acetobacteraceae bacterium]